MQRTFDGCVQLVNR